MNALITPKNSVEHHKILQGAAWLSHRCKLRRQVNLIQKDRIDDKTEHADIAHWSHFAFATPKLLSISRRQVGTFIPPVSFCRQSSDIPNRK